MKKILTFVTCLCLCLFQRAYSQEFELEEFAEGFTEPIYIANDGIPDHLYVGEKAGKIWIVKKNGKKLPAPFLDISGRVKSNTSERGLLSFVFHPNYAVNKYFFVAYTNKEGDIVLSRFNTTNNPLKAAGSSETILLTIFHPFTNHNAGCLQFGKDGYLYMSNGDGGDAGDPDERAQDPMDLLGKMLRLDVNGIAPYTIPPTNPFVNVPGYRPEIWALGLRNPWRWSFDKLTGDMFLADVGQDFWEEVNLQPVSSTGGENYGWDCYEGLAPFEPANCADGATITFPIITYPHGGPDGDCTVIGGYVYRGTQFPDMVGKYFYNDYCSGWFRMASLENGVWVTSDVLKEEAFEYVTFGEATNGELYVADILGGEVLHFVQTGQKVAGETILSSGLSLFPNPNNGTFTVKWDASADEKATVEVTNLLGQSVFAESKDVVKGSNEWSFSLPENLNGNYILTIHSASGMIMKKFAVE